MPRQPRLDAPGTLHHVMGRRVEASMKFRTKRDREDFIDRLAELSRSGRWAVYAWALRPNRFHLLVRTGTETLARSRRRLMAGYAINFNLRHKNGVSRSGRGPVPRGNHLGGGAGRPSVKIA